MRLSGSFVAPSLLALAGSVAAGSAVGHVYIHDVDSPSHTASAPAQTLSPQEARLVFAQRLGLSQYHSLKGAAEQTIQHINDFGGKQHALFGDDESSDDARQVMVFVEGVKDTAALKLDKLSSFALSNTPGADANSRLLEDFTLQSEHLSSSSRDHDSHSVPQQVSEVLRAIPEDVETRTSNGRILAHIKNSANMEAEKLSATIRELADACASRFPLTLVVLPPTSGSVSKRASNPYGQYDVPKRSANAQRKRPEAILSESVNDFIETVEDSIASASELVSHVDAANPLRGILPACFASQAACESATNNCTGHGKCYKKYSDKDNNNRACFTCKCKPDVKQTKAGKKTTNYGGPACQKKDVVMPFWLFAGFAIAMSFTIAWAVGLLFSMGNEELPSVIGAGVSGPSARH